MSKAIEWSVLKEKILVEVIKKEKTKSGIILSDTDQSLSEEQKGRVTTVGKEIESFKIDDVILFDRHAGDKIKIDNKHYLLLDSTNILATIS